jgi:hypothetical protein
VLFVANGSALTPRAAPLEFVPLGFENFAPRGSDLEFTAPRG